MTSDAGSTHDVAVSGIVQWENGNEFRRYPLADDADMSCHDGSQLPNRFLTDAMVVVGKPADSIKPASSDEYGRQEPPVVVSCAHVGPGMVSVGLSCGDGSAVCTVPMGKFEPYTPYQLVDTSRGSSTVSGFVSFGDVSRLDGPFTWRPVDCRLNDSAVVRVPVSRFEGFLDPKTGNVASGNIEIDVPSSMGASVSDTKNGSQILSLDLGVDLDEAVKSPCESSEGDARAGDTGHLRSINGILPDENGVIAVVFK